MTNGLMHLKSGNMGYYTFYSIDFEGDENKVDAIKKDLIEQSKDEDGDADCWLEELLDCGEVDAKLYDLEDWIDAVAPRHPDVLVVLQGDGEEKGDSWERRWKGTEFEAQYSAIPPFKNPKLFTNKEITNNN